MKSSRCEDALKRHFGVASLDGFGLRGLTSAIRAAGAILQYLTETQPAALKLLTGFNTYQLSEFMTLDAATRRNLELTETIRGGAVRGSLLGELDHAVTPMGKRLLRQWVSKPLLDVSHIRQRQDGVTFFFTRGLHRAELRAAIKPLNDLERLAVRIAGGSAQPRDLVAMRQTLSRLDGIAQILQGAGLLLDKSSTELASGLENVLRAFNLCTEELALLEAAIADDPPATLANTGIFRPGFSAELDGVVERSRHARQWMADLEGVERERTGIKTLEGRLQQGLWLLHRDHPRQFRAGARRVHPQANPGQRRALHHPRDEGIRGAGA